MIYNKPPKKRYVDMAIEFDKEFYTEDRDDTKLFQYLYHLYYMRACKRNFFGGEFAKYDEYAIYAATIIYLRFIRKQARGEHVKSVLNYVKGTENHLKIMYQNDTFQTVINPEVDTKFNPDRFKQVLYSQVQQSYNAGLFEEMESVLVTIPDIIKSVIAGSPYKNQKIIFNNIYISCMLSIINSIILSKQTKKLINRKEKSGNADYLKIKAYQDNKLKSIILWHLDDSMYNYIYVLTNIIRKKLSDKLDSTQGLFNLDESTLDTILASGFANSEQHDLDSTGF